MGPLQRTLGTASTAFSQNLPWLRRRERISLVKNRMREICTSGSVRGGGGNIPTYSAFLAPERRQVTEEGASVAQAGVVTEELEPAGGMQLLQLSQEQPPEQLGEHANRQQETGARRDPACSIERDATAGRDQVDVRVVRQRRAPYVDIG